jgi:hypothetical protein
MNNTTRNELTHLLVKTAKLIAVGSCKAKKEIENQLEKLENLKADLPPLFAEAITMFNKHVKAFSAETDKNTQLVSASRCLGEFNVLTVLLKHNQINEGKGSKTMKSTYIKRFEQNVAQLGHTLQRYIDTLENYIQNYKEGDDTTIFSTVDWVEVNTPDRSELIGIPQGLVSFISMDLEQIVNPQQWVDELGYALQEITSFPLGFDEHEEYELEDLKESILESRIQQLQALHLAESMMKQQKGGYHFKWEEPEEEPSESTPELDRIEIVGLSPEMTDRLKTKLIEEL